jgi:hypothetical protein
MGTRPPASALGAAVSAAVSAAGAWLLEPARPEPAELLTAPPVLRPVVAVFGLARACGATVVARALAAELARRDPLGAAAVHAEASPRGIPLATAAATRLARALADLPRADTRAVGRLCLIGGTDAALAAEAARATAPLVLDAGGMALGGVAAALADEVVVVATPATEPALAEVAADYLGGLDREPIVVVNRARGIEPGAAAAPAAAEAPAAGEVAAAHVLPESRLGAQLALCGREPRGGLGQAVAALADRCERR